MKVLIWIGCIFVATILNTLLGYATGIKAGYLVFYLVVYFVAKKLCEKWDERQEEKETIRKACEYYAKPIVERKSTDNINNNNVSTGQWRCSCGRSYPKYVSSCVCGKSKSDCIIQSKPTATNTEITQPYLEIPSVVDDRIRFCRKCGAELLDNSRFCCKCGTGIVKE